MQVRLECIPCFARQSVAAARLATDDVELQEQIIRAALRLVTQADFSATPFEIGQLVHRAARDLSGREDPYLAIKQRSNAYAVAKLPELNRLVAQAENPLMIATKIAITGNLMDFGVPNNGLDIQATLARVLDTPFAVDDFGVFARRLAEAKRVLYLADNAGEIVFDGVLIEQLDCPEVTVVVKDEPFINDAMQADAESAGFGGGVHILAAPLYPRSSPAFQAAWAAADLIISKGQANYEAYSEVGGPLFYLLVAKCDCVADEFGVRVGEMILQASQH